MPENKDIGIINEVGDLGLGYTELSAEEKEKIKENEKDEK